MPSKAYYIRYTNRIIMISKIIQKENSIRSIDSYKKKEEGNVTEVGSTNLSITISNKV